MIEVLDMIVVSCDSRRAVADFVVWSPKLSQAVKVRCQYALRGTLEVVDATDQELGELVRNSKECLADMKEAVMWQRDLSQEMN